MEARERVTEWRAERKRLLRDYPVDPKVVYLASCYRSARGEYGVREYIQEAADTARKLWKLGLAVISPVLNTAYFGGDDIPTLVWFLGDFALVRRCDALVMHQNAGASKGAEQERQVALDVGLPIFYLPEHFGKLAKWAKDGTTRNSEVDSADLERVVTAGCEVLA